MYILLKKTGWFLLVVILTGYLLPNNISSPIEIKDIRNIDPESFWYYPWGESIVHRGIDIFCEKGTTILSPVSGLVFSKGYGSIGGNYLYIIGPKWRTYYFAHMDTVFAKLHQFINRGDLIGRVGSTGNAANKPAHLHYSIATLLPYFWRYDSKVFLGWKKTFYLDPINELNF